METEIAGKFKYEVMIERYMALSEKSILTEFARELREIVESFEEEVEIVASEDVVNEIMESEIAYRNGEPTKILKKLKKLDGDTNLRARGVQELEKWRE